MQNTPQTTNQKIKAIIQRTRIDESFAYRGHELSDIKLACMAEQCEKVLDIGKSSRHRFSLFRPGQAMTMDINQYEDYPDILDDICKITHVRPDSFDGVIGNSILEHVYDPHAAVTNISIILKHNGAFYGFAPFLYRYHAPEALHYQDFYRYTKDGLAYLFRDFRQVTLYPVRGRISTMLNLSAAWKSMIEKTFGHRLNSLLDRVCRRKSRFLQVSGYYIWAQK